ncbi:MAG TPA: hypothetical protein VIK89_16465 [Cytophagaceae bacterium]
MRTYLHNAEIDVEEYSNEHRRKSLENGLILRKSLLKGQSTRVAYDNIKLRNNLRKLAKSFLKGAQTEQEKNQ